jgi:AcrR family transcriptional regulator
MANVERNPTQRERLLRVMVEVANRRGYAGASVAALIAEAGVSRRTFYEHFDDRDDCIAGAIVDVRGRLLTAVESALGNAQPGDAVAVALGAILDFADEHGAEARFLMGQSMSAGRPALDSRDQGIVEIAAVIAATQEGIGPRAPVPDLDHRILLGSVYRMIATRLRRGQANMETLGAELLAWVAAYEVPSSSRRWSEAEPITLTASSPQVPVQQMPDVFPPGRPRVSPAEISENQRLRIMYAVARLAESKGYTATTTADVIKLARVDGRTFYRLFTDRQEAFSAAHELGFQQVMDVTTSAYFSAEGWAQRSWEAGKALSEFLQANPLVGNVGFVEAYASGPAAVQRIEDSHTAFLFFLQEGLLSRPPKELPSRVAMEAIIAAVFEVIYIQARRGEDLQVAGMLPYIAHLWLTPFLGTAESNRFIDAQLRENGSRPSKPRAKRA